MKYRHAGFTALLLIALQAAAQASTDPLFSGIEKFKKNAISVVWVESDRDHREEQAATATPRHFSDVYVFKYEQPGQYNAGEVESYRRKLHTPEWTCKVCPEHLKSGEVLDACTRPLGGTEVESAVIDMMPTHLTFVHSIKKSSGEHQTGCSD